MAIQGDRVVTVRDAARNGNMSQNHLVKISQNLARLGYTDTARGKGGGMRLAHPPASINVGELIRRIEPTLEIVDCQKLDCPLAMNCLLKLALVEARDSFLNSLDRYTVADLVQNSGDLARLFGIGDSSIDASTQTD